MKLEVRAEIRLEKDGPYAKLPFERYVGPGLAPGSTYRIQVRRKPLRYYALDAFKFIAILLVIVIHAKPIFADENKGLYNVLNLLARGAVPFFLITSGFFLEKRLAAEGTGFAIWKSYLQRLGLPLLVWAAFYAVMPGNWPALFVDGHPYADFLGKLQDVRGRFLGEPVNFLLSGGMFHLWFLVSLLIGISLSLAARQSVSPRLFFIFSLCVFCAGLIVGPYAAPLNLRTITGGLNFAELGPALGLFYIQLGGVFYRNRKNWLRFRWGAILLAVGFILQGAEASFLHVKYGLTAGDMFYLAFTAPYAAGIFMVLMSFKDRPILPVLASCGRFSLGMYAIHVFWLNAVTSSLQAPARGIASIALVLAVFGLTAGSTLLLARVRFFRPILA